MVRALLPLLFCCLSSVASAANTSIYTPFDISKCQITDKPDEYVYEGTVRCKGIEGYDIHVAGMDARHGVGFGADAKGNCSIKKTFSPFNTALSPIEWRLQGTTPIAAIERWSTTDGEGVQSTWLVVSKLESGNSCHMHYVAGSFPNANEAARTVADEKSAGFDCMTSKPAFASTIGAPPIQLTSCMELEAE